MLTAVRGYYDGKQIVVDEQDRAHLRPGDQVVVTVLSGTGVPEEMTDEMRAARAERRRRILAEGRYVHPTGRSAEEIDQYIRELRGG